MRPGTPAANMGLLVAIAFAADASPRVARPTAGVGAAEEIHLDGRLDEPAWASVSHIGTLLQGDPKEGAAGSEETDVRLLRDKNYLYIGATCRDQTSSGIVSTQLGRDADLEVDDRITVVLDPFFDHKNGFFFMVNPAGARADGQISNNSQELSYEWDAIWDAGTPITDDGWVAEIAIHFQSLRFKPGQTVWGFNVERQIKRLQEQDRWASPRRDIWIGNLVAAGQVSGLTGLRQGRGLDIRPFVSAGEQNGSGKFSTGLDVFKSVTASLTASLTVNTDFAETETDAR
ncbi:MAG: carbohydrate binding family 9 domain-containing protein [Acidobacteria bacterium]|nr:carbohydrate binding family 9 domain-containing protein [Acidobacteriota bacterium]